MNLKVKYNKALEFENQLRAEVDKPLVYDNFQSYEDFYAEVYQRLFQDLFAYGMQICRNKELVKDSIQELFSELWKNQKTLVKVKSVKPYLLKCLKRKIKRTLGKTKRLSLEAGFEFEISPETELIRSEQQERNKYLLHKSLQSLTERQREALYLKFYKNLTYEEVSQVLSIKTKAAYKLIYRALSTLKTIIKTPY